MRLFAGVGADMHSQGAPLDERLAASAVVARVGSLVGVYPVVSLEVRLAVEALFTMSGISKKTRKSWQRTLMQSGSGHWKGRWLHSAMVWSLSSINSRISIAAESKMFDGEMFGGF